MSESVSGKQPPIGDIATERRCARLLGHNADGSERLCGSTEVVQHVIYRYDALAAPADVDGWDHGFCCAQHWREYQELWSCAGSHPVSAACGMPGSRYYHEAGVCVMDDELPVAEPVRAIAVEV